MKLYVADTNVLLERIDVLEDYDVVILSHVIRELENHKKKGNGDLAYRARIATRWIEQKVKSESITIDLHDYTWDGSDEYENQYVDNKIISACIENGYGLITSDIILKFKAVAYDIELINVDDNEDLGSKGYTGVKELYLDLDNSQEDNELLAKVFTNLSENVFELKVNEYLLLWNKNKPVYDEFDQLKGYELIKNCAYRWNGSELEGLKFQNVESNTMGMIKPRNVKQQLLFDLLQNKSIKVKAAFGKYGTGKDYTMLSHAMNLIEKGKFDKIVFVRNNIELEDSEPIGFRKGDNFDKLSEMAAPIFDHVGGIDGLRLLVEAGIVELQHLGTIRGRDIKNAIIYVTEVQNNTKNHLKLLLGRVGEGSELWINGDIKQIDRASFLSKNAIAALSPLYGHKLYGQVVLDKTERSKTAELAELI